jgi:hypothetical protein
MVFEPKVPVPSGPIENWRVLRSCGRISSRREQAMTTITPELRRAIEEGGGQPTHLVDPETNATYVLIRAEQFERLRSLLSEEVGIGDLYPAVDRVFRAEGWDDPTMDVYDDYDTNKP